MARTLSLVGRKLANTLFVSAPIKRTYSVAMTEQIQFTKDFLFRQVLTIISYI